MIKLYKRLYITRNQTFQDDTERLQSNIPPLAIFYQLEWLIFILIDSLTRLRNEFRMNRDVSDPNKLEEVSF